LVENQGWKSFSGGYFMVDFEEIMEKICDTCHWPYVCSEDELEEHCAKCEAEATIKRALSRNEPTEGGKLHTERKHKPGGEDIILP